MNTGQKNYLRTLVRHYESVRAGEGDTHFREQDIMDICLYYYDIKHDMRSALDAIEWGLVRYPFSGELMMIKADLLLQDRRADEACALLDKAWIMDTANEDIFILRYEVYIMEGDLAGADAFFNRYICHFDDVDRSFIEQEMAEILEDYGYISEVLDYLFHRLYALAEKGEQAVLETLSFASHKSGYFERVDIARVGFYAHITARHAEAAACYDALLKASPFLRDVWFMCALTHHLSGEQELAQRAYKFASALDMPEQKTADRLLQFLLTLKSSEQVVAYIERIKDFLPFSKVALYRAFARSYFKIKNFERAEFYFLQILSLGLTPYRVESCKFLARSFMRKKDFIQAVYFLEHAMRVNAKDKSVVKMLADSFAHLGRYPDALFYYLKAISNEPNNVGLWRRYLRFLYGLKMYEEGAQQAHIAHKRTRDPLFIYYMAGFNLLLGNMDKARTYRKLALQQDARYAHQYERMFESVLQKNGLSQEGQKDC